MSDNKIEQFWRDATAEDVMNGKEIEARFRDDESFEWSTGKGCLIGYKQGFWISRSLGWKNCEMLWQYLPDAVRSSPRQSVYCPTSPDRW